MTNRYWQWRVLMDHDTWAIMGTYAESEAAAVQEIGTRFPKATALLPYSPTAKVQVQMPSEAELTANLTLTICGAWTPEYLGTNWPYCGHCAQIKDDHPVMRGTDAGNKAEAFMANPMSMLEHYSL